MRVCVRERDDVTSGYCLKPHHACMRMHPNVFICVCSMTSLSPNMHTCMRACIADHIVTLSHAHPSPTKDNRAYQTLLTKKEGWAIWALLRWTRSMHRQCFARLIKDRSALKNAAKQKRPPSTPKDNRANLTLLSNKAGCAAPPTNKSRFRIVLDRPYFCQNTRAIHALSQLSFMMDTTVSILSMRPLFAERASWTKRS